MPRPVSGIIPLLMIVAGSFASASELAAPRKIKVAGRPIDVEHVGHAAPFVGDIDGDGRKDLLVGEYYKGRLRIYRNVGTNAEPRFEGFTVFQDGAPSGCIWAS